MLATRPLFYASYRDIFDALWSSKLRVSTDFMHDFLRHRGIILSGQATRRELVEAIASYAYESADLDELCGQLEVHSRADRVSYMNLTAQVQEDMVREAVDAVRNARRSEGHTTEVVQFKRGESGRLEVGIEYYEIDEGRTLLRQHRPKEGKIEFMSTGNGMRIRFPGAERVQKIAADLIEELGRRSPELGSDTIDLSPFNRLQRTRFFQLLIQKVGNFRVVDVKKVNVDRELAEPVFEGDSEEEQEDVEDDSSTSRSAREVSQEVKSYLKKCTLSGSGILHASELRRFLDSDFFISRIVWEAQPRSKLDPLPKAELEALLEFPAEGEGFKYTIRGVYPRKRNRKFATTKRRPNDLEREQLLDLLEIAAQQAFLEVLADPQPGEGA